MPELPVVFNDPNALLVHVKGGLWEAYGLDPLTPRQNYLIGVLNGMGGINHSVPEGYHLFWTQNVLGTETAHLEPYQE